MEVNKSIALMSAEEIKRRITFVELMAKRLATATETLFGVACDIEVYYSSDSKYTSNGQMAIVDEFTINGTDHDNNCYIACFTCAAAEAIKCHKNELLVFNGAYPIVEFLYHPYFFVNHEGNIINVQNALLLNAYEAAKEEKRKPKKIFVTTNENSKVWFNVNKFTIADENWHYLNKRAVEEATSKKIELVDDQVICAGLELNLNVRRFADWRETRKNVLQVISNGEYTTSPAEYLKAIRQKIGEDAYSAALKSWKEIKQSK